MSLDMNLEDEKVVIQTDEGDLVYKVALTFECPENGKSYVGFTDDKTDESVNTFMDTIPALLKSKLHEPRNIDS